VQVRLQSDSDGTILSTFTDDAGSFRVASVPNGSYTLTVFEGLHETSEELNIMCRRARSALQKAVEALNKNKLVDATGMWTRPWVRIRIA
jgi:hypothetical protein